MPTPHVAWADRLARRIRTNRVVVAVYSWIAKQLAPFLFALVAALVGLLFVLPAFIPKFIRNAQRRRRYEPRWVSGSVERIPPDPVEPPSSPR